jgi:lysophospholipase L1-like esterase
MLDMGFQTNADGNLLKVEVDPEFINENQKTDHPQTPKDECKVILFGGSISQGIVYNPNRNRYQLLKSCFGNQLQEQLKGQVLKRGRIGNSLKQAMTRFKKDVLDEEPDFVIIEFGGNDSDFDWEQVAQAPFRSHQPKVELREFEALLRELIQTLNKHEITPIIFRLLPASAEQYIHWLTKEAPAKRVSILQYLGSIQNLADLHLSYDAVIRKVAQETHTHTIDIRKKMLHEKDFLKYFCVDGIHPNAEGHDFFADIILDFFKAHFPALLKDGF